MMCLGWLRRTSTSTLPIEWAKQIALERWIATERHWIKKNVSRGLSVLDEFDCPAVQSRNEVRTVSLL